MGSAAGLSSISIYAHLILSLSTTKSEGEDGYIYGGVGVVGTAAWHACGVFLSLHVKQEEIEDMVVGGGGCSAGEALCCRNFRRKFPRLVENLALFVRKQGL